MRVFHLDLTQSSLATTDVQSLWDKFESRLQQGIDKFIPVRKAGTRDGFPWINQEISRLIRKRDKLYKRWSRSGRPYDHNNFLGQNHLVRRVSERAYEKYLGDILGLNNERDDQNMVEPPKVKTKKLYSLLKHSKQDSGGIASLKKDGQTVSAETDKVNTLHVQFQSVFSPKTPVSVKSLAQKSLHDSGVDLPFQPNPYPKMPDISLSAEGIGKLLLALNPHKAAGPDKLKPIILQTLHEELSPILQLIFRKSLENGKPLDVWKEANFQKRGQSRPL